VEQLGVAMGEHSLPAERPALEQLSLILHEIADTLLAEHVDPAPADGQVDPEDALQRASRRRRRRRPKCFVICCSRFYTWARLRPRVCRGSSASVRMTTRPPRVTRREECG
jgi:hypothetical protein